MVSDLEIMLGVTGPRADLPDDWPECEEFYNLMQHYRHMPIERQTEVVEAYEAIKQWLRKEVSRYA
ncbi:hypothetical protein LCGC14_3035720 [marine sediment metagenome]|uniref:Uncharacterized protein n=1 Tax=marine sediment metagenome TaxID=412755 RepID=A0A0F8WRJ5_9ZZZZ